MQYRTDPRSANQLSILGLGCMRLPRNLTAQIDQAKAEALVLKAVESGVNYFDCAYLYPGSEQALGAVLAKHQLRDKVYIATKLPIKKCETYEDFDRLFQIQLDRLQTDYIDYYLMHNLSDMALWQQLCGLGIEKWLAEKKAAGQIRQVGYSFHGMQKEFLALIDAYDWDFCQIQYNYANINYQAGRTGLKRAAKKGLPVIIMEPLLGGKLANGLPKKAVDLFAAVDRTLSPAAWALRWLWDQSEVTVVLSGMGAVSQLEENLCTAEYAVPGLLTEKEQLAFESVLDAFNESYKVPCTGCNYCMPCPTGVNIPGCFAAYNMSYTVGMISAVQSYATSTGSFSPEKDASAGRCIKCGKCVKQCPQHIQIPEELGNVKRRMEPFWYRGLRSVMGGRRKKRA